MKNEAAKAAPYAGRYHWRRGRDVVPTDCEFPGCGRPIWRRGLCRSHKAQEARGKELTLLRPYRRHPGG